MRRRPGPPSGSWRPTCGGSTGPPTRSCFFGRRPPHWEGSSHGPDEYGAGGVPAHLPAQRGAGHERGHPRPGADLPEPGHPHHRGGGAAGLLLGAQLPGVPEGGPEGPAHLPHPGPGGQDPILRGLSGLGIQRGLAPPGPDGPGVPGAVRPRAQGGGHPRRGGVRPAGGEDSGPGLRVHRPRPAGDPHPPGADEHLLRPAGVGLPAGGLESGANKKRNADLGTSKVRVFGFDIRRWNGPAQRPGGAPHGRRCPPGSSPRRTAPCPGFSSPGAVPGGRTSTGSPQSRGPPPP